MRHALRDAIRIARLGALLVMGACASPGAPPGGPEDRAQPRLLRTSPDTGARNARPREVVFTFDEVVSETPRGAGVGGSGGGGTAGAGDPLAPLVLLSPRSGSVEVDWRREQVAVRPRRGFRPNTTYTVTLLPGLSDLRDNVRDTAVVAVFSTGDTIARGRLGGVVFDWINGRPAAGAIVEAIAPDSTVYVSVADSVGRFVIPNLASGSYVLKGVVDLNTNRSVDPREAFDTASVDAAAVTRNDTTAVELYAFVRDTAGVRLQGVTVRDSLTLRLTFDRPLLPGQPLTAAQFRLLASDSTVVPLAGVYSAPDFDSLQVRRERATADSLVRARPDTAGARTRAATDSAARRDSLARVARDSAAARRPGRRPTRPPPVPGRPTPTADVVIVLQAPLRPQAAYRMSALGILALSRIARGSERVFNTPRAETRPPAAPPAAPPAGTPTRPDSTRAPSDTTRRPPP